jgi:hypothetical protein
MFAFDTHSFFWKVPYKTALTIERTARLRSWKKTATAF